MGWSTGLFGRGGPLECEHDLVPLLVECDLCHEPSYQEYASAMRIVDMIVFRWIEQGVDIESVPLILDSYLNCVLAGVEIDENAFVLGPAVSMHDGVDQGLVHCEA